MGSKLVKHTLVLAELACCRLCTLLQVCMGLEFFLIIPKTFDDLEVISVIFFAHPG